MKVLFAGPSIHGLELDLTQIDSRPPAAQSDVARAVAEGATAIGLIDGVYESVAAIWHKEILFALERGVTVLGAASMGALRAAECASFGMRPIGSIAGRYLDGSLDDDAAVAITHAPAELGFAPLSEALVDAEATIRRLADLNLVTRDEAAALLARAKALFFKDRTVAAIVGVLPRADELAQLYAAQRVGLKQQDAMALVEELRRLPSERELHEPDWRLERPSFWRRAEEAWSIAS